jgi:hypothetical protein
MNGCEIAARTHNHVFKYFICRLNAESGMPLKRDQRKNVAALWVPRLERGVIHLFRTFLKIGVELLARGDFVFFGGIRSFSARATATLYSSRSLSSLTSRSRNCRISLMSGCRISGPA